MSSVIGVDNTNQSWRKDWKIGDRYSIQKILGAGSYGDVAKVIDTKTGEIVWFGCGISQLGCDQKDRQSVRRLRGYEACSSGDLHSSSFTEPLHCESEGCLRRLFF